MEERANCKHTDTFILNARSIRMVTQTLNCAESAPRNTSVLTFPSDSTQPPVPDALMFLKFASRNLYPLKGALMLKFAPILLLSQFTFAAIPQELTVNAYDGVTSNVTLKFTAESVQQVPEMGIVLITKPAIVASEALLGVNEFLIAYTGDDAYDDHSLNELCARFGAGRFAAIRLSIATLRPVEDLLFFNSKTGKWAFVQAHSKGLSHMAGFTRVVCFMPDR